METDRYHKLDNAEKLINVLYLCRNNTKSALRKDILRYIENFLYDNDAIGLPEDVLKRIKNMYSSVLSSYNNFSGDKEKWYGARDKIQTIISRIEKGKEFLKNVAVGDFVEVQEFLRFNDGNILTPLDICKVIEVLHSENRIVVRKGGTEDIFSVYTYRLNIVGKKYGY